jgi:copper(I)-binding protein
MLRTALIAAAVLAASSAHAASYRSGPLEVINPWSRPAVSGFNGVGYMTLVNHGRRAERLVGASSPIARSVEPHRSQVAANGVASMKPAPGIQIPPGGTVTFRPGGYHLMLMGLAKTLKPGDRALATLVFSDGRKIAVSFQVTAGGPPVGRSDAPRRR